MEKRVKELCKYYLERQRYLESLYDAGLDTHEKAMVFSSHRIRLHDLNKALSIIVGHKILYSWNNYISYWDNKSKKKVIIYSEEEEE